MKAVVCTKYGAPEVLELRDVPKPTPKDNEVLIKIYASTVSAGDFRVRSWTIPAGFSLVGKLAMGFSGPRKSILGGELSGVVESVGKSVTEFKTGDQVFAFTGANFGANAEYICVPESGMIAIKPNNLTHEESAAIPFGGLTALDFLRDKGNIQSGQKVLVYGASGAVGTAAVQLAKYFGAEVTAVCSTGSADLVKSLGADHVIDYTREDFSQGGEQYDIVMETVGKATFEQCMKALKPTGTCLLVAGGIDAIFQMIRSKVAGGKKIATGVAPGSKKDLEFLRGLIEAGKFQAVIDRRFPLAETREAHRYVELGHKKGVVVIAG